MPATRTALAVPALAVFTALSTTPALASDLDRASSRLSGTIAFVSDRDGGTDHIFTVAAAGGAERQLTSGPTVDRAPQWSPNGRLLVFNSRRAPHTDRPQLYTLDVSNQRLTRITRSPEDDQRASFAANSRSVFFQRGSFRKGFSIMQARVTGGWVRQLTDRAIGDRPVINAAADQNSRTGELVLQTNREATGTFPFTLASLDPTRACAPRACRLPLLTALPIPTPLRYSIDGPRWSPNGRRIAFAAGGDLYLFRPSNGALKQVTRGKPSDLSPDWSPDGDRLVFQSNRRVKSGGIHVLRLSNGRVSYLAEGRTPVWAAARR